MKKVSMIFTVALSVIGLFASLLSGVALAQGDTPGSFRWEATVGLYSEGVDKAGQDPAAWLEPLQSQGVEATLKKEQISLKGQADLSQMRSALFDTTVPGMDFLGGPVELTLHLPAGGTPVILKLEARIATGYIWEVVSGEGVMYQQTGEPEFAMRYRGIGVPSIQTIHLKATGTGDTSVRLIYRRSFEPKALFHAHLNVWINEGVTEIELSDPTPPEILPDGDVFTAPGENPYAELDELHKALPTSWDWRSKGIVPAVRNQGSCGSCWAFGTVSVMESAVKKGDGPLNDLSEQFLVSCNKDGWNCDGGWTATKYHYTTLAKNQTQSGAVLETDKPYTATDGTCSTAYTHPYKANSWKFITGSEYTMPTVSQIKNAIYTYGPVTAGVCADSGWDSYSGGVYNPSSNQCGSSTNHQIVLVGWNDATSSWIMRNSWGTGWGESGYMRIAWDTTGTKSRVGEGTSWVRYVGTVPVPQSPGGTITDKTPTYTWTKITGATDYRYQLLRGTTPVYTKIVTSSACGASSCSNTPATTLGLYTYKWLVQAKTGGVWRTYSPYKTFTVANAVQGFNSPFTNNATGWSAVTGTWVLSDSNYYKSSGLANTGASAKYTTTYGDFTYEVRMKRSGVSANANRIIIRGNQASLSATNWWKPSYVFQYSNDGYFSIYEMSSGSVLNPLQGWTTHAAIIQNNWNTLKVVAVGSLLKFYINNTLVWSGSDASLKTGKVGFGFYRNSDPATLYINWAKLTPTVTAYPDSDINEMVVPGVEVPGGSIDVSP